MNPSGNNIHTHTHKSGTTVLRAFMTNNETFSTGVIAISLPPSAAQYATVCSAGVFNSPWMGDNFNKAAAEADYTAFEISDIARNGLLQLLRKVNRRAQSPEAPIPLSHPLTRHRFARPARLFL